MDYRLSRHAQDEMARRGITSDQVHAVLTSPGQVVQERNGRRCYQSRTTFADGQFLLRVIVVDTVEPAVVVTVYRTSRHDRYWRS
jgi:hypothetical protein